MAGSSSQSGAPRPSVASGSGSTPREAVGAHTASHWNRTGRGDSGETVHLQAPPGNFCPAGVSPLPPCS